MLNQIDIQDIVTIAKEAGKAIMQVYKQDFEVEYKQDINQTDIDSVVDVLQSDFLTQGPQVPLFEKTVLDYCSAEFGVAVNSATSALHIACLALGLGKGDWLWTSPNSFKKIIGTKAIKSTSVGDAVTFDCIKLL